jgi:hypothetical protein
MQKDAKDRQLFPGNKNQNETCDINSDHLQGGFKKSLPAFREVINKIQKSSV